MPWECPSCERVLKNANQWHCCVKKEFDELFERKNPVQLYIFEKLLAEIFDWEKVHISATKKCIVFLAKQTFLVVKPMRDHMLIKFYLDYENIGYPIHKITKYGKWVEHHIHLNELEQIDDQIISFIRASYNLLKD